MGEVEEKGLLFCPRLVEELDAPVGPQIGAVPRWIEPGVILRQFLAVQVETSPALRASLIGKMDASGGEIQAALESARHRGDTMLIPDVPFPRRRGEVACAIRDLGHRHAFIIEPPHVAGGFLIVRHPSDARLVRIKPRQQRRPCRTAASRIVELAESDAVLG